MGLFDRSKTKELSTRPSLLLTADPGDALLDAARRYDPEVRPWHGRLVFANGVLLFGPIEVTPKMQQEATLPAEASVAYYTGVAAQRTSERRAESAKQDDAQKLLYGLAVRLGGKTSLVDSPSNLALLASVYSEQAPSPDQVVEVLRPYGGEPEVERQKENSYSISGKGTYFYTAYWSPQLFVNREEPAALGKLRAGKLHHWDLNTGVEAKKAARELCLKVGEAALALADTSGGMAIDMFGFRIAAPEDMLLR
ncbi:MAG TPA: hypothetical protein VMF87_22980 [Streptosporangiaceae bacterium]|nr:hypothetical protein [Streptosporangiaceae bacterium]